MSERGVQGVPVENDEFIETIRIEDARPSPDFDRTPRPEPRSTEEDENSVEREAHSSEKGNAESCLIRVITHKQQPLETSEVKSPSRPSSNGTLEITANGTGDTASETSSSILTASTSTRTTNPRFANIRAAFESRGSSIVSLEATKRRVISQGDHRASRGHERNYEYETEIARLKNEVERERGLRVAYEDKVTMLEGERDDLASKRADVGDDLDATLALRSELETERDLRIELKDKVTTLAQENNNLSHQLQTADAKFRNEMLQIYGIVKELGISDQCKEIDSGEEGVRLGSALKAICREVQTQRVKRRELEQQLIDRDRPAERDHGDPGGESAETSTKTPESHYRSRESTLLRQQLTDPKQRLSETIRLPSDMSDATLAKELGLVQHEVQNWIVHNFRKTEITSTPDELCDRITKITDPRQAEFLCPVYRGYQPSVKLAVLQSTVACYLMEVFDDPFLFGLRKQQDWTRRVRLAAQSLPAALDAPAYNHWRSMTFGMLQQSGALGDWVQVAANGLAEIIYITLITVTGAEGNEANFDSLKSTVMRAVSFAHSLRVQQTPYSFVLPAADQQFDATLCEDVGGTGSGRPVRCATFPAMLKLPHQEKHHPSHSDNVLFRAKVVCWDDGSDGELG